MFNPQSFWIRIQFGSGSTTLDASWAKKTKIKRLIFRLKIFIITGIFTFLRRSCRTRTGSGCGNGRRGHLLRFLFLIEHLGPLLHVLLDLLGRPHLVLGLVVFFGFLTERFFGLRRGRQECFVPIQYRELMSELYFQYFADSDPSGSELFGWIWPVV